MRFLASLEMMGKIRFPPSGVQPDPIVSSVDEEPTRGIIKVLYDRDSLTEYHCEARKPPEAATGSFDLSEGAVPP